MPRQCRLLSEQNIYHIVMKGINANPIFFDDNDYKSFLKYFKIACKDYNVEILAYCVMNNHIHFMLKFNGKTMAELFKSFGARFVPKYNAVHSRVGPLFNGRYYSSPINDDRYLLSVLRYIHYNPVKSGICKNLCDYKWSSYNEYFEHNGLIANINYIENLYSENELQMLHIIDDQVLDDAFVFTGIIYGVDEEEIIDFLRNNENRDKNDLIRILKQAKISKRKISKHLTIDRRSM